MSSSEIKNLEKSFVALLNKESELEKELDKAFAEIEKRPKAQNNSFEEAIGKSKNSNSQKSL